MTDRTPTMTNQELHDAITHAHEMLEAVGVSSPAYAMLIKHLDALLSVQEARARLMLDLVYSDDAS